MNLYLLRLRDPSSVDYDSYDGFVVAGESPEAARALVTRCGTECPAGWDHPKTPCVWHTDATLCDLIGAAAPGLDAGVVLASFHAG